MNTSHALYSNIELETEVMSASKHRLIQLMLERCLLHMSVAKKHILEKNISKKHQSLSKIIDIIGHLRACLNHENKETQELSALLDSLYQFIEKNLLKATLKNEIEPLNQAEQVLVMIKSGWDGIG